MTRFFRSFVFVLLGLGGMVGMLASPIRLSLKDAASNWNFVAGPILQEDASEDGPGLISREELSGFTMTFRSKPVSLFSSGEDSDFWIDCANPTSKTMTKHFALKYIASATHKKIKSNFFSIPMQPGTTMIHVTLVRGSSAVLYEGGYDTIQILLKKSGLVKVADSTQIQWVERSLSLGGSVLSQEPPSTRFTPLPSGLAPRRHILTIIATPERIAEAPTTLKSGDTFNP
jgi:hypothetical protein